MWLVMGFEVDFNKNLWRVGSEELIANFGVTYVWVSSQTLVLAV